MHASVSITRKCSCLEELQYVLSSRKFLEGFTRDRQSYLGDKPTWVKSTLSSAVNISIFPATENELLSSRERRRNVCSGGLAFSLRTEQDFWLRKPRLSQGVCDKALRSVFPFPDSTTFPVPSSVFLMLTQKTMDGNDLYIDNGGSGIRSWLIAGGHIRGVIKRGSRHL